MKTAILDLDDTLYDYVSLHPTGLSALTELAGELLPVSKETFLSAYLKEDEKLHAEIPTLAACHNRMLIVQRALEQLKLPPFLHALELYEAYWGALLKRMEPKPGVIEFLRRLKKTGLSICLCTDMTAHIQQRKIAALGLASYFDAMVTSEETGAEKPDARMFLACLQKTGSKAADAFYIGDNFSRDIIGAAACGIFPIWLNDRGGSAEKLGVPYREIASFVELT